MTNPIIYGIVLFAFVASLMATVLAFVENHEEAEILSLIAVILTGSLALAMYHARS